MADQPTNSELLKQTQELQKATADLEKERSKLAKGLIDEGKLVKQLIAAQMRLNKAEKEGAANVEELRSEYTKLANDATDADKAVMKLEESIENQSETIEKNTKALEKSTKELEEYIKKIEKSEKALAGFERGVSTAKSGLDALTQSNLSSVLSLKGFMKNVISVAHRMQELEVGLARSTGRVTDFKDNLTDLTKANSHLSISLTEGKEIIEGLSTGMTRFNLVGEKQQRVLQNISARFKRLGADTPEFAQALDRINFGFGMTGEAAAEAARSLEDMSDEVGRPLGAVIKDLNDVGPTLARFGQNGLNVFRKLNFQARELGLTVKEAFDLTEVFDTFESSANVAGRLNAQLGLQLNSVEIMKASTEDRLDILRQEFRMQGKNFATMGRRQKQMVAGILGMSEEAAAKALGDGMDISSFQKQKAKDKTLNDVVSYQETMVRAIEALGEEFAPAIRRLIDVFMDYARHFGEWAPKVLIGLAVGAAGSGLARGGMALSKGLAAGALPGATGALAAGGGLATAGAGAMASLGAIPLVGQAIGGIGQGVYEYQKTGSASRGVARGAAGITGGLAGAAAGAALGTMVVPVIGTAIGGILGGIIGQFGGGLLATSIMGDAEEQSGVSPAGKKMRTAQSNIRSSQREQTIMVKEMTIPLRIKAGTHEFSPVVETIMNTKLHPIRPK